MPKHGPQGLVVLIADEDGLDILGLSVVQDSLSTTSSFKHRRFDDVAHLAELWSLEQRPRSEHGSLVHDGVGGTVEV